MRIVYFSFASFTDCDFPLIRELQRKKYDVRYFFPLNGYNNRQGLLDIKTKKHKKGIYKASEYPELSIYKDYIDLNKIYVINDPHGGSEWKHKLFWICVYFRILLMFPKVFHFTWQLYGNAKYLYYLPCKKAMTVHDPISHSNVTERKEEEERMIAFRHSNHYVLLSDVFAKQFENKYLIASDRVTITRMGEFNHLRCFENKQTNLSQPYILFFGQIYSYKGIEYLCEAMTMIHNRHPHVNLVIAGKGEWYFDISKYENLSYITLRNEYIAISELASLLQGALFAVCPYKDATQSGVVQTAFSANLPLVVTNVGALPMEVKDDVYGRIVPPCDSVSLADVMDDLLTNRNKLERYRDNIDKLWRPSMDWGKIADKYISVWERCC